MSDGTRIQRAYVHIRSYGKAAAPLSAILAVAATLAACGAAPHKVVAVHTPRAATSTTIHSVRGAHNPRTTTTDTAASTTTSAAIAPTTTTAVPVSACAAGELTMTAHPQLPSYNWNDTMQVVVQL